MDLYIYIYTYASRVPNFARPNMFCSPYSQAPRLQRPDSQSKYSMCFFHFYFYPKHIKLKALFSNFSVEVNESNFLAVNGMAFAKSF